MRDPSPAIMQKNPYGAETACMAQLLYIHGDFELHQWQAFNTTIGWRPDEGDTQSTNLYYMLRAGYQVHEVTPVDPKKIVLSQDYLQAIWQRNGETEQAIKNDLPKIYPLARKRALFKVRAVADFSHMYSCEPRESTPEDVFNRLKGGWKVVCDIEKDGDLRHVLVTRMLENEQYEVFDPMEGISRMYAGQMIYAPMPTLQCYRKSS